MKTNTELITSFPDIKLLKSINHHDIARLKIALTEVLIEKDKQFLEIVENQMYESQKTRNMVLREQAMHFNGYDNALVELINKLREQII